MGAPATAWTTAFELIPAGSDLLSTVDTAIQGGKVAVRERMEREHNWGVAGTQSKHGWHRAGSAMAFYQATAPTTKMDPAASALDADDAGRIFIDSDDFISFVWDGSAWQGLTRELARVSIQGTLAVGTNVVPRIVLPRACKILKVSAYCETAPTGASILIDINKNGTASIFSGVTRITIAAAANADHVESFHATNKILAADDTLTIDLDQVGSTVAGADISITIEVQLG
jgi:hypothetical protein